MIASKDPTSADATFKNREASPKAELCDLTDQCTDNSDEETEECADAKKDTFENDEKPFGLFNHNEEYSDFEWERGSGTGDGWFGGSPPFDHTTFSNRGHYLYIKVIIVIVIVRIFII